MKVFNAWPPFSLEESSFIKHYIFSPSFLTPKSLFIIHPAFYFTSIPLAFFSLAVQPL